ncbi:MAG: S53 family peptidase [Armatimonadetes bacterium]|nr:S53 family peptidase [Armatimonadota bacterium]
MKLRVLGFAVGAVVLVGCGGGGDSSNGILPPAPDPVCTTAVPAQKVATPKYGPNVIVPQSSLPTGSSLIAHTNHLIYRSSGGSRANSPQGLVPSQVLGAYGIPSNGGSGAIAIIVAYNYVTALNDFNNFSAQFGLPTEPSADPLSAANQVFQVIYATGTKPTDDAGWGQEAAIDTQWAHAMAPNAKIYLVEAASPYTKDLMDAAQVARALPGVRQVSMSFGAAEDACQFANYDGDLVKAGVTFFASAGDTAGEKDFPGLSRNVVCVGGTTLDVTSGGVWINETAWNGTGGGKSGFEPRPTFQDGLTDIVGRYRGGPDISAVADPATGVSVYDSTPAQGVSGWIVFGGTSVSTPIIAGIANVAGGRSSSQAQNAVFYAGIGSGNFNDITTGASGSLSAGPGYDLVTGVGTPNGLGGF